MAGGTVKSLVIGAVLGAGATTGVVVPLTGEQYVDGAAKVEMSAVQVDEATVTVDSKTGAVVDPEKLPEGVKPEDVKEITEPAYLALPMAKINTTPDGKPIVLEPGKLYRMIVEMDGKILAESHFTPKADEYPTDGDSLVGVFKFDVRKDKVQ